MQRDPLHEAHEGDGSTPLEEDELDGLIPSHLATRADLNQWEVQNIALALEWRRGRSAQVLDVEFLKELHRRMFDQTWTWAGSFRQSDKNVSPYHWPEVPRLLKDLVDNIRAQLESTTGDDELDKVAARFHHALVRIHPWPNGNGRHGRLATDLLLSRLRRPPFSWGAADGRTGDPAVRERYIDALRRADQNDFSYLYAFVRA